MGKIPDTFYISTNENDQRQIVATNLLMNAFDIRFPLYYPLYT